MEERERKRIFHEMQIARLPFIFVNRFASRFGGQDLSRWAWSRGKVSGKYRVLFLWRGSIIRQCTGRKKKKTQNDLSHGRHSSPDWTPLKSCREENAGPAVEEHFAGWTSDILASGNDRKRTDSYSSRVGNFAIIRCLDDCKSSNSSNSSF